MTSIALVVHPERLAASRLARDLAAWLGEAGHEVVAPPADAEVVAGLEHVTVADDPMAGAALAVSLGGDGTMLRTVQLVGAAGVPILGVNLGQLGYLTDVEPAAAREAVEAFLAGDHGIEERMMLDVRVVEAGGATPVSACHLALNEAVLERTLSGHTVRIEVEIDGSPFTPYEADGLIVATPTGSTAYAFSTRGPIVAPTHRLQVLTPVSAHMLFDRTLVLEPDTDLRLVVAGERPATLTVDGRKVDELVPGAAVLCRGSQAAARLVTFGRRDFPNLLKRKFRLADR